jgi:glycosyltransferase involved in cell wall biosynthesis
VTHKVSIVIPTFNRAKLVSKAIDTALSQTVPVEVVLCDHGSTDATPEVAKSYGDRIRYIRKETDQGPIACWQDGIENASGDLVHINYDDDWIDNNFVERTMPLLKEDVAFVYTRTMIHTVGAENTEIQMEHPGGIRPVKQVVQHLLRAGLPISPGCALFRKKDLQKNLLSEVPGASGIYGKKSGVGEDLLVFLLATLDYTHYAHVPEPLAHFLAHPTSITTNAGSSGKMNVLVDAYAVAKQHYLQQSGSFRKPTGISGWIDKRRWKLAARMS